MEIKPEFEFGDEVYLIAARGNEDYEMKGAVLGYEIRMGGILKYEVRWADLTSGYYYGLELSDSPYQGDVEDV